VFVPAFAGEMVALLRYAPDAKLKNFIFYIFRMYEFSHRVDHLRPFSAPTGIDLAQST
jgi:hypothetical protein